LFAIVFMVGLPTAVDEDVATDGARLTVVHVVHEGPADVALLPVGAQVTGFSVNGDAADELTPSAFAEFTQANGENEVTIAYTLDGQTAEAIITPEKGLILDDPERAAVGVALSLVETVKEPVHEALWSATKTTVFSLKAITIGIATLLGQSVQGTADFSQVAGPIGIVGLVGDAAEFGLTSLLMFTAVISLNLAVINMLPFPALDGGRLVMVGVEVVTRKPINPVWVARLNIAGFMLLMLLMILVTFNDLTKIF